MSKECLSESDAPLASDLSFADFVQRIVVRARRSAYIANPHFWPQSWFCRLRQQLPHFGFVIQYSHDASAIGESTLRLLRALNLSEFYYHWGAHGNLTMFDDEAHVTYRGGDTLQSKLAFYRQHFDRETALKCIELYRDDYALFKLDYPEWIEHL